jgi:hypothetical protein
MTRVHYFLGTVSRHAQPGTPIEGDGTYEGAGEMWAGLPADSVRLDDGTLVNVYPEYGDEIKAMAS